MRFFRLLGLMFVLALGVTTVTQLQRVSAQETTGGLQGVVKDPSGAVIPKAKVALTGSALIGSKNFVTDSSGYYRFANLPPGTYTLIVKAQGFSTYKRDGLAIQVGHLPSLEVVLQVGAEATTVEVTGSGPVIDATTTENMTNISAQSLQNLPTGTSFQSVIQFAPMARNEPLAGYSVNGAGRGGTGGGMPGSSGNGNSFGYSIGGAADSESSYLVEGQDTENISGGYSKANVPMEFIQEVQMKTSGISAEFGGALGGVVNVIMKKGSNDFHGELFSSYESSGMDANSVNPFLRYDPTGDMGTHTDVAAQLYQPKKDHFRSVMPGITIGGPIKKDKIWFSLGFEPQANSRGRSVNFGTYADNAGVQYFTRDQQTYFGMARVDAQVSKKIRAYGSWLYQYSRASGVEMPTGDPTDSSMLNEDIQNPLSAYVHGMGWSAPNSTYNFGADITINQHLVSTTRFGYFFENYHDFGWQTTATNYQWYTNGYNAKGNDNAALPQELQYYNGSQASTGTQTAAYSDTYTLVNANKHWQFNQDFAFYKSNWAGTHNFKFGYQLNHLQNVINQHGNVPWVRLYPGAKYSVSTVSAFGGDNCDKLGNEWQYTDDKGKVHHVCAGQYGYARIEDVATIALDPVNDWNHAFYAQDSWNLGHGLTLDVGIRVEKEKLPPPSGYTAKSIDFSWADKIAPRVGAAWDPTGKGKMKIFGSYGVVNDVMKLLIAQTSWGAQAYENCYYPLGPDTTGNFAISDIDVMFKNNRACPSASTSTGAYFTNGATPSVLTDVATQVSLIENANMRPWEPVAPGVKPYRQHEYVIGFDYQLPHNVAFEVRYDRRRLDHAIEDAALSDVNWGETFAIVNPGEGVNATIDKFANYLSSIGEAFGVPGYVFDTTSFGTCPACKANPKPIRNYDGVEFRLTLPPTNGWTAMFSYTFSSLWGNYSGLTSTDQSDAAGRNSPDTSRAFDEPFYYFGANGKSTDGALGTDRPNVFKGNVYKTVSWKHQQKSSIGLFQMFYQGTPAASYIDVGSASTDQANEAVYVFGRDKWVDMKTDSNGNITLSNPYTKRTPWYIQSDLSASHEIKTGDHQTLKFEATALNVLNQRSAVSYFGAMNSWKAGLSINPNGLDIYNGASSYAAYESGYDVESLINSDGITKNSQYGKADLFQNGRSLRMALRFSF